MRCFAKYEQNMGERRHERTLQKLLGEGDFSVLKCKKNKVQRPFMSTFCFCCFSVFKIILYIKPKTLLRVITSFGGRKSDDSRINYNNKYFLFSIVNMLHLFHIESSKWNV